MGTKDKVLKIIGIGAALLGVISAIATIYVDVKWVKKSCPIVTSIGIGIVIVLFIYYGMCVLQSLAVKREEKSAIGLLNVSTVNLAKQYKEFQEYIQSIEDTIGDKIVCPANIKTFEYSSTDVTRFTNELLEKHPNAEIHIICFGRNGYGDVIEHVREKELKVKAKIVVYNPEADICICRPNDDIDIRKHIRNMLASDVEIEIYASNIPPSIRACVIYENGKPIWGAMQSYRFEKKDTGGFSLCKPKNSLIAVCGEKSSQRDFSGMIKCFEEEFAYLLKNYCIPELINNKVEFKEHQSSGKKR